MSVVKKMSTLSHNGFEVNCWKNRTNFKRISLNEQNGTKIKGKHLTNTFLRLIKKIAFNNFIELLVFFFYFKRFLLSKLQLLCLVQIEFYYYNHTKNIVTRTQPC